MVGATALAIIGMASAAASIGMGVMSMGAQKKASQAQQSQMAVENKRALDANYAQQVKNIRQTRLARAQSLAAAQQMGVEESSSAIGATGSIMSQGLYNASTLAQDQGLAMQSAAYGTQAARAMSSANQYNALGSIFGSVSSLAMSYGYLDAKAGLKEAKPVDIPSKSSKFVTGGAIKWNV